LQIVRIGLPSALEAALYNTAMTLIISLLNRMDSAGIHVTARSYAAQITNFSYCAGAAFAQANAIIIGWNLGAKRLDECDKSTKQTALFGIIIAVALATLFAAASGLIMGMFTDDSYMKKLVGNLLLMDIILEVGRVTNLVFGSALKTSGDAVFTTIIAVIFMYLCAVGGTYLFGVRWNWLVIGAYAGMTLDECARAACMLIRWNSGKWRSKLTIV
jgi:Na+-driven multidrug efflux pump